MLQDMGSSLSHCPEHLRGCGENGKCVGLRGAERGDVHIASSGDAGAATDADAVACSVLLLLLQLVLLQDAAADAAAAESAAAAVVGRNGWCCHSRSILLLKLLRLLLVLLLLLPYLLLQLPC